MNPTYLGEIDLSEETLAHYGVPGMKWGRRKARQLINNNPLARRLRRSRNIASHLADDIGDGRRELSRSGGQNARRMVGTPGHSANSILRRVQDRVLNDRTIVTNNGVRSTTQYNLQRAMAARNSRDSQVTKTKKKKK